MTYFNGITDLKNSVVTEMNEQMCIFFEIKEVDESNIYKLQNLLDEANPYEGYFKIHKCGDVIKRISYETDCSDDWLCHGSDTFAQIIQSCVKQL